MEDVTVLTVAGCDQRGCVDGVGTTAQFSQPSGLHFDPSSGRLLVAEVSNQRIRCVFPGNPGFKPVLREALQFLAEMEGGIAVTPLLSLIVEYSCGDGMQITAQRVYRLSFIVYRLSFVLFRLCRFRPLQLTIRGCRLLPVTWGGAAAGAVITILGCGTNMFRNGTGCLDAGFVTPYSVCADPLHPSNLYIGDATSIRYADTANDFVSVVVGGSIGGFADGIGSRAMCTDVSSLLCTHDGKALYFADSGNDAIRSVDPTTRQARTIVCVDPQATATVQSTSSLYNPHKFAWDRTRSVQAESALFITSATGISRLTLATKELVTCCKLGLAMPLFGILSTPSGHLLVALADRNSICVLDYSKRVADGPFELIAGGGRMLSCHDSESVVPVPVPVIDGSGGRARFSEPRDLVVSEIERCLYVADSNFNRIRCVQLPDHLFSLLYS